MKRDLFGASMQNVAMGRIVSESLGATWAQNLGLNSLKSACREWEGNCFNEIYGTGGEDRT
jgi:hypothetical protein